MVMLSRCILLPQYKNSLSKAQTTAFKNSLLKIGGVDARSLVEIKRRRIGYTLSIFSRGMDAAGYIRSDVSAVSETHSQNYTRMYSFDDATTQIPAYFQKILDTHSFVGIITQQLSNSATQQLSNSATRLCPYTRAAFFSQISFFSLISDVLGYIRKRKRLRTYSWHRLRNRYWLWNTFFTLFYIQPERGGGYTYGCIFDYR